MSWDHFFQSMKQYYLGLRQVGLVCFHFQKVQMKHSMCVCVWCNCTFFTSIYSRELLLHMYQCQNHVCTLL